MMQIAFKISIPPRLIWMALLVFSVTFIAG